MLRKSEGKKIHSVSLSNHQLLSGLSPLHGVVWREGQGRLLVQQGWQLPWECSFGRWAHPQTVGCHCNHSPHSSQPQKAQSSELVAKSKREGQKMAWKTSQKVLKAQKGVFHISCLVKGLGLFFRFPWNYNWKKSWKTWMLSSPRGTWMELRAWGRKNTPEFWLCLL